MRKTRRTNKKRAPIIIICVAAVVVAVIAISQVVLHNNGTLGKENKGTATYVKGIEDYVMPNWNVYQNESRYKDLVGTKVAIHGTVTEAALGTVFMTLSENEENIWCNLTIQTQDGDWKVNMEVATTQETIDSYIGREFYVYGEFVGLEGWRFDPVIDLVELSPLEQGLYEVSTGEQFRVVNFKVYEPVFQRDIEFGDGNNIAFGVAEEADGTLGGVAYIRSDGKDVRREAAMLFLTFMAFDQKGMDYSVAVSSGSEEAKMIMMQDGENMAPTDLLPQEHITIVSEGGADLLVEYSEDCLRLIDSIIEYFPEMSDTRNIIEESAEEAANESTHAMPESESQSSSTMTVNNDDVNLRSEPSTDSDIITKVSKPLVVEIIEQSGDWYKVRADGQEGYIRSDYLD